MAIEDNIEYVIDIILKGRDNVSADLAKVRAALAGLNSEATGLNKELGEVNEKVTSLNQRSTAAAKKVDELTESQKRLKEAGGQVVFVEQQETAAVQKTTKARSDKSKAISEGVGASAKAEAAARRRDEAEKREREEVEKGTRAVKMSRAERKALDDQIIANAKSTGQNTEANTKLAQTFKDLQKEASAARKEFKRAERDLKALESLNADGDRLAEGVAILERKRAIFEVAKAKREEAKAALDANVASFKEEGTVKKTTKSTKEKGEQLKKVVAQTKAAAKATDDSTAATERETEAVKKNTAAKKENVEVTTRKIEGEVKLGKPKTASEMRAEAEDSLEIARRTREELEATAKPGAAGREAKAKKAKLKKAKEEAAARTAQEAQEAIDQEAISLDALDYGDDGDDDEFGSGIQFLGGGAPKKKAEEEAARRRREGALKKEKDQLAGIKEEYDRSAQSLARFFMALRGGEITEEAWLTRLGEAEKKLRLLARQASRLSVTTPAQINKILTEADALRERGEALRKTDVSTVTELEVSPAAANARARERQQLADQSRRRRLAAEEAARKAAASVPSEDEVASQQRARAGAAAAQAVERNNAKTKRSTDDNRKANKALADQIKSVRAQYEALFEDINAGTLGATEQRVELGILGRELSKLARNTRLTREQQRQFGVQGQHVSDMLSELNHAHREHARQLNRTRQEHGGFIASLDRMAATISKNGESVAQLDNRLRGMLVLAVMAFAQQLISAMVSLAGAFTAVASSATMAGGAIAGAFASGVAQGIPMIGLLIAGLARLKSIMDVVNQAQTVEEQQYHRNQQAGKKLADTSDAVASAQDGLLAAQERVADAHDRVADAQQALTKAREDARTEIRELIQAEREAEMAAKGAAIAQKDAQEALRMAVQSGDVEGLASAELSVVETRQNRRNAVADLGDARRARRRAERGGVEGMEGVRDAKEALADARKGVQDAERAVEKASRGIDKARRNATAAAEDSFAAASKLEYLLAQLSPAERKLYQAITRVRETYKQNFRPITDIFVNAFTRGVNTVDRLLKDRRIIGSARGLATSMTAQMDRIRKAFTSNEMIDQFVRINKQGEKNLKPLGDIIIDLGKAWMNIAEAAGPAFHTMLGDIGDLTGDFRKLTEDSDKMEKFFDRGAVHFGAWLDTAKELAKLFAAIVGIGEGTGLSMVEDLGKWAERSTKWVKANREAVNDFFEDSKKGTYLLLDVLGSLAEALIEVFDPERMEPLAQFITDSLIPALERVIIFVGGVTSLIFKILDLPIVGELSSWVISFLLFSKVVTATGSLFQGFLVQSSHFFKLANNGISMMQRGSGKLLSTIGQLLSKIPGLRRLGQAMEGAGTAATTAGTSRKTPGATAAPGMVLLPDGRQVPANSPAGKQESARQEQEQRGNRRKNIGRGFGIAAVAGAAMAANPADFTAVKDIPGNNFAGRGQLALDSVAGAARSLMSLDLKGFWNSLSRDTKGFAEWAETAESKLKKFRATGNVEGLKKLRAEAQKYAKDFPEAAEAMGSLTAAIDEANPTAKKTGKALDALGGTVETLKKAGIKAEDITDPKGFQAVRSAIDRLAKNGADSIGNLRTNMALNKKAIDRTLVDGSQTWALAISDNFTAGIQSISKGWKNGKISTKDALKEIRAITRDQLKLMRDNMDNMSWEGREALARNFRSARLAIERQTGGWENATKDALKEIRRLMSAEWEAIGMDPDQARELARNRTTKGREHVNQWGGRDEGGRASGGVIGQWGERGRDMLRAWIGRGEVVLNHWQQKALNAQLPGQTTVRDVVEHTKGLHAGIIGEKPGFAFAGGYAGKSPSGNRTVAIPGFPGEFIAAKVLKDALNLIRRFNLGVTDAFARSGHRGAGHLQFGTAIDVVPGAGGSWDTVDRAVAFARRKGLTVLYNGVAGHGRGHHAHIELAPGSVGGGGADAFSGKPPKIRRVRAKGPGNRNSELGLLAQLGVDVTRDGVNRKLKAAWEQAQATSGDMTPHGPNYGGSSINIARTIIDVAKKLGASSKVMLAAIETGIVESGLRNLSWGDRDSQGVFQQRPSQGWGTVAQVRNVRHAATSFIRRAIANADKYGSAGELAQSVQRSAFPDRYNAVRAQAAQILRRLGIRGFNTGGGVPGFGGGDVFPAMLEGGEHVWTKDEVMKAGGHGVMRALRAMLGGGGQSSGGGYRTGGEVKDDISAMDRMFTTDYERDRIKRIRQGIYRLPTLPLREWEDVVREANRAMRALSNSGSNWKRRIRQINRIIDDINDRQKGDKKDVTDAEEKKIRTLRIEQAALGSNKDGARSKFTQRTRAGNFEQITREGGVLDQMAAARERLSAEATRGVTFANLKLKKLGDTWRTWRAFQGGDPVRLAERELMNARENLNMIVSERGVIQKTMRDVNQRLRALRKNGVTDKEASQVRALETQLSRLRENFSEIRDAEAEALQTLYDSQIAAHQAAIDKINKSAEQNTQTNELWRRIATALGNEGAVAKVNEAQRGVLQKQADDLEAQIGRAKRMGNTELAEQLTQQVRDLKVQIFESIQQDLRDSMERINSRAQRRLGRLDLIGRMGQALGNVGLDSVASLAGESFSARGLYNQRQAALGTQRSDLQGLLRRTQAESPMNVGLIEELTDQLAELDVTIQENTQQWFNARLEDVNRRADFGGSVIDLRKRIVELKGTIAGVTDNAELLRLERERTSILQQQRTDLVSLYDEAVMSGNQQAVNDLTTQLLQNEVALLENTQAVNELSGITNQPQTFTSAAWRFFREAVFTGMGDVLPQYSPSVGLAGQTVLNSGMTSPSIAMNAPVTKSSVEEQVVNEGDTVLNIYEAGRPIDTVEIDGALAWAKRNNR